MEGKFRGVLLGIETLSFRTLILIADERSGRGCSESAVNRHRPPLPPVIYAAPRRSTQLSLHATARRRRHSRPSASRFAGGRAERIPNIIRNRGNKRERRRTEVSEARRETCAFFFYGRPRNKTRETEREGKGEGNRSSVHSVQEGRGRGREIKRDRHLPLRSEVASVRRRRRRRGGEIACEDDRETESNLPSRVS